MALPHLTRVRVPRFPRLHRRFRELVQPPGPIGGLPRSAPTWARFLRLGPRKLATLAVAYLFLWSVRLGLRRMPFSRFRSLLARVTPLRNPRLPLLPVCWAIRILSHRLPWASCLIQAAAGHLLLALCGVPSRVAIGVRLEGEKFLAHAWLESGGQTLLGAVPQENFRPIYTVGRAALPQD